MARHVIGLNHYAIGIENVGGVEGALELTEAQVQSNAYLVRYLKNKYPTIQYLIEHGASIVLCSHLGRPEGPDDISASLKPVAVRLSELLQKHVKFGGLVKDENALKESQSMQSGEIMLLENLRFYTEEEANDTAFAEQLAQYGEIFVQDGFGVVHRAHASTDAVTKHIPSVAGLLLEREVDTITNVMENPVRPLMAIIAGSKISDKIDILNRFIDIADFVAVGGAMANTFLMAQGIEVGVSKVVRDDVPLAQEIIEKAKAKSAKQPFVFYLPQDGVVAKAVDKAAETRIVDWSAHVYASVENYPKMPPKESGVVAEDELILDIGPFSGAFIAGGMQLTGSVLWNGPMGVTEVASLQGPVGPFAHGTELIVEALLGKHGNKPFSVLGGGDTVAYIEKRQLADGFDHVSTGGGASMELMSGKALPGITALLDK